MIKYNRIKCFKLIFLVLQLNLQLTQTNLSKNLLFIYNGSVFIIRSVKKVEIIEKIVDKLKQIYIQCGVIKKHQVINDVDIVWSLVKWPELKNMLQKLY